MALTRIQPAQEIRGLQERMNDLFEDLLARTRSDSPETSAEGSWTPPVDLLEAGDRIVLRADLPGVTAHDLEIRIEGQTLTVRGERRLDPGLRREDYLRIERPFGAFSRTFHLPSDIDPKGARAELRQGLLEITLSRRRDIAPEAVEIRIG